LTLEARAGWSGGNRSDASSECNSRELRELRELRIIGDHRGVIA
jgi:hypothetical protein